MQKSATVAVINSEQKLLLLRRGNSAPWMPGRYCLPGGRLEPNEELVDGAARELGEETGIFIVDRNDLVPCTIHYSTNYSKTVFVVSMNDPVVSLNWEHDSYAWVGFEESTLYDLVPGTKAAIKVLGGRRLLI